MSAQRPVEPVAADRKQFEEPGIRLRGDRKKGTRPVAIARPPSRWWPHIWKLALLWVLVFAAYSNSFDAGFVYDNESAILQDARVHETNLHNTHRIFTEGYWVDQPTTALYRPLTTFSYLLNYAILGNATTPAGYHWMNLVLHLNQRLARLRPGHLDFWRSGARPSLGCDLGIASPHD